MLRSLLLSRQDATVRVIARGFKDFEVELESCADPEEFVRRLHNGNFDALVLDDEVENAAPVLGQLSAIPSCSKAVRIVLADPKVAMNTIFKTGTQVVLYKPLSTERVRQGLRAVRNLMARERRRGAKRVTAMVPARISARHSRIHAIPVLLADISDTGAAIRYEKGDLPVTGTVHLEFALPGTPDRIHCLAELVWQDYQGSGGLRFADMPNFARQQLSEWLKENQPAPEPAPAEV